MMTPGHILLVAIMIFSSSACLTGLLLLLKADTLAVVAHGVVQVCAFGFLQGLAFALTWGGLDGILVYAIELHFTLNLPNIRAGCEAGFVTGAAAGFLCGGGAKAWRLAKRQLPTKPQLNGDQVGWSAVAGALVGFLSHSAATQAGKFRNAVFMGSVFSITSMLKVIDWWNEELMNRYRMACAVALIVVGGVVSTAAYWLDASMLAR